MSGRIVIVTSGFPRISETFALNEFLALERAGAIGAIFATKPGDGHPPQPGADELAERIELLPDRNPEAQARRVVERVRGSEARGVHAYFAHQPTAVAERAARALGLPYSFSVHARDIRKVPAPELRRRARRAACVIACNGEAAGELRGAGARVELVPHGVDLDRFDPAPPPPPEPPLRLLAVGRLVAKKGLGVLLEAVAGLPGPFRLRIVGEGPLRAELERAAAAAGQAGRIALHGAVTHRELPRAYAEAHVVVVPSVEDADGDRDGLPNVVLEAMASGRPVVASRIAAIPSAVRDGATGFLTAPGDPLALRAALERLRADPALRARMGDAGRAVVERRFDLGRCTGRMRDCLEDAYG
jgi:glycosyltransferase involved in cell wall biosynthesis